MRALVTRPRPDAARTAAALARLGHEAVIAPLLGFVPLPVEVPADGGRACIVATSANALKGLPASAAAALQARPFVAVGARTAGAAREAGFTTVETAGGDAAALIRHLRAGIPPGGTVLFLAGRVRKPDLERDLASAGIRVEVLETYEMAPVATLPEAAARAIAGPGVDVVLHYSRRTAETFLALTRAAGLHRQAAALRHLCLSPDVAEPLVAAGFARSRAAARPDEASLLALL
jgi:uroporphyrinogen-III synthase